MPEASPIELRERAEQLTQRVAAGKLRLERQERLRFQWSDQQRDCRDLVYYRSWTGMMFDQARYHLERDIQETRAAVTKLEQQLFYALRAAGLDASPTPVSAPLTPKPAPDA